MWGCLQANAFLSDRHIKDTMRDKKENLNPNSKFSYYRAEIQNIFKPAVGSLIAPQRFSCCFCSLTSSNHPTPLNWVFTCYQSMSCQTPLTSLACKKKCHDSRKLRSHYSPKTTILPILRLLMALYPKRTFIPA